MTIDKKMFSVLGIAIISFFSTLWIRPATLMEARNFISAREIIMNNEWLVTTLNGAFRFEKPPLPTWLTALTMEITNNFSDEWILRIPVAIVSVLLALYMYKFVNEFVKNSNIAFVSSCVLSTTFMVTNVGTENTWDAYPYIFMFISLFYCVRLLHTDALRYVFLASFFFACSALSKGPVALYGMFLPFCISYAVVYRFEQIKQNKGRLGLYILLGLALASFWPIAMMLQNADLFTSVMLKEESSWTHKHIRPCYFYLDFFGFMGVWALFTLLTFTKKWKTTTEQEKLFQFGRLWAILTFIFLSVVSMKKERYGFPMYVEFAIPLGILIHHYLETTWNSLKNIEKKFITVQYVLLIIACLASAFFIKLKAYTICEKIFLTIPFYIIVLYIASSSRKDKDTFKKSVIYGSVMLMLCINTNLAWLIEYTFRGAQHVEIPALEELQKTPLNAPVYSNNFSIEEVWSVGQNIKKLDLTKPLPLTFYMLGDVGTLPEGYEIVKQTVYRVKQNKDKTVVFSSIRQSSLQQCQLQTAQ